MSRLQIGGLALIVGYENSARNVGKTVQCIKYLGKVKFDDGSTWDDAWLIGGDDLLDTYFIVQNELIARGQWLMPLGDKSTGTIDGECFENPVYGEFCA